MIRELEFQEYLKKMKGKLIPSYVSSKYWNITVYYYKSHYHLSGAMCQAASYVLYKIILNLYNLERQMLLSSFKGEQTMAPTEVNQGDSQYRIKLGFQFNKWKYTQTVTDKIQVEKR